MDDIKYYLMGHFGGCDDERGEIIAEHPSEDRMIELAKIVNFFHTNVIKIGSEKDNRPFDYFTVESSIGAQTDIFMSSFPDGVGYGMHVEIGRIAKGCENVIPFSTEHVFKD